MNRVPVRVISGGRVTIPKGVREELDIEADDRVWIEVEPIDDADSPYSRAKEVAQLNREG